MKLNIVIIFVELFFSKLSFSKDNSPCLTLKELNSKYSVPNINYYLAKYSIDEFACLSKVSTDSNELWVNENYSCNVFDLQIEHYQISGRVTLTFSQLSS